jgi:hypothetical protein
VSPMKSVEADQATSRVVRLVLYVVVPFALATLVGAVGVGVTRWAHGRHPGGDPHGHLLHALVDVLPEAIPPSAKVVSRHQFEPIWDSCDGRSGTLGWDPARVVVTLALTVSPTEITDRLPRSGWTRQTSFPDQQRWSRHLSSGRAVALDLLTTKSDGSVDLVLSAQPPGPMARGC